MVIKQKSQIRQQLLRRLLTLTAEEIKRRSSKVEALVSGMPLYAKAKVVAVYYPLKGEVDILGMIRKAIGKKRFCFPVTDTVKKQLRFFEVADLDKDFIKGPFGTMQPDTARTREVDIGDIDMVIVPGIAFDRHRNRLGRGAGFYDRFLAGTDPSTAKIGVAFDFQVLESLPIHLAFDQKVSLIVSEQSIV